MCHDGMALAGQVLAEHVRAGSFDSGEKTRLVQQLDLNSEKSYTVTTLITFKHTYECDTVTDL